MVQGVLEMVEDVGFCILRVFVIFRYVDSKKSFIHTYETSN